MKTEKLKPQTKKYKDANKENWGRKKNVTNHTRGAKGYNLMKDKQDMTN